MSRKHPHKVNRIDFSLLGRFLLIRKIFMTCYMIWYQIQFVKNTKPKCSWTCSKFYTLVYGKSMQLLFFSFDFFFKKWKHFVFVENIATLANFCLHSQKRCYWNVLCNQAIWHILTWEREREKSEWKASVITVNTIHWNCMS